MEGLGVTRRRRLIVVTTTTCVVGILHVYPDLRFILDRGPQYGGHFIAAIDDTTYLSRQAPRARLAASHSMPPPTRIIAGMRNTRRRRKSVPRFATVIGMTLAATTM